MDKPLYDSEKSFSAPSQAPYISPPWDHGRCQNDDILNNFWVNQTNDSPVWQCQGSVVNVLEIKTQLLKSLKRVGSLHWHAAAQHILAVILVVDSKSPASVFHAAPPCNVHCSSSHPVPAQKLVVENTRKA